MTSLKTSIKTITYLSDIGCLEIQGASLNAYLYFSCADKNINGGGSWNITPMPNTDVCVQVLRTIESHGGRGFGNTGECIEVKTNKPLNNVMDTLNGGQ